MKKICFFLLVLTLTAAICACGQKENVPNNFEFSLVWNTYGVSSYDSESGMLVKTTDATHPEDYKAEYYLTDDEKAKIGEVLSKLDINSYPDEFDPNDGMMSSPSMTLILTYKSGDKAKTVTCKNIAISYESNDLKGQKFLTACREIIDILTETDTWKAFPEYEFLYY